MKKLVVSIAMILGMFMVHGQDLPEIVPPSPNAAAFHVYGNNTVNNYTGAPNIEIPIYTIKEGDLTLPITLKYTAGNGVKVEEVASWVGLGWTLNTGGAVSRIIRGRPDEDAIKTGFLNRSKPVPPNSSQNYSELEDIANSAKDGEPDKFMYNYNGGAGSFFFNYDGNVYLKPLKNIEVNHSIGNANDVASIPSLCSDGHSVIENFTIKDEYGNSYFFNDRERSNTISVGSSFKDTRGFPSTWYISRMTNRLGTREINFSYTPYNYELNRRQSTISLFDGNFEKDAFTRTVYVSKQLKKISFSNGSIDFIVSNIDRKDLQDNKYLERINIKNKQGAVIKSIVFTYKYMTNQGLVNVDVPTGFSKSNRLVLSSVQECGLEGECKPATVFTYNTNKLLPPRDSKSIDHWGYYNGKNNTSLEPKQNIRWYNSIGNVGWTVTSSGSANRAPDSNFSIAGILKEVKYPTGGKTVLDYESHKATTLEDIVSNKKVELNSVNQKKIIELKGVNTSVKFNTSSYISSNSSDCPVRIHVKNKKTGISTYRVVNVLNLDFPNPIANQNVTPFSLDAGTYEVWYILENRCTQTGPANIALDWEEVSSNVKTEKSIGGLRINKITSYTAGSDIASVQNFSYLSDENTSSGSIVAAPVYHGLTFQEFGLGTDVTPIGYKKYATSTNPLTTTQGSHVGYGKVTVFKNDGENGKEEFYYRTPEMFPDNKVAVNSFSLKSEELKVFFQGAKMNLYPLPEVDSKDFLRGLLLKHISYKKTPIGFVEVMRKENIYDDLSFVYEDIVLDGDEIASSIKVARGVKTFNWVSSSSSDAVAIDISYYDIYTGYNVPKKTITTYSYDSGMLTEIVEQKYKRDNLNLIDYFMPIYTESTDSEGKVLKTENTYVFNKSNKTTIEQNLYNSNAVFLPLETKNYNDTQLLSTQRTLYKDFAGNYLPEIVQAKKGTQTLENRVVYHSYNAQGNPTEVSKQDGTHIVYIWGYNDSQPVAKIENATLSEIPLSYITNVKNASNADTDRTRGNIGKEGYLRQQLNSLRSLATLQDAQVTTFTYDPLIGVTSITDPRGEAIYYEYDSFNRLQFIRNKAGHILKEHQYNYKN